MEHPNEDFSLNIAIFLSSYKLFPRLKFSKHCLLENYAMIYSVFFISKTVEDYTFLHSIFVYYFNRPYKCIISTP